MYTKIEIFEAGCEKCGHSWIPKDQSKLPGMCPSCKSKTWHTEKDDDTAVSTDRNGAVHDNNESKAAKKAKLASSEPLKTKTEEKDPVLSEYSEEKTVYDPETGEDVTYIEHLKKKTRIVLSRKTAY
jgi:predicted  nucleic acid-binding Zn-ribbon protein